MASVVSISISNCFLVLSSFLSLSSFCWLCTPPRCNVRLKRLRLFPIFVQTAENIRLSSSLWTAAHIEGLLRFNSSVTQIVVIEKTTNVVVGGDSDVYECTAGLHSFCIGKFWTALSRMATTISPSDLMSLSGRSCCPCRMLLSGQSQLST